MKERGSEGAKVSVLGRARENDNFLALLLNKSVSIATIQPAAGESEQEGERKGGREREREGKEGVHRRDRGKDRKRERVTIATEEEGEKELEETLKKTCWEKR